MGRYWEREGGGRGGREAEREREREREREKEGERRDAPSSIYTHSLHSHNANHIKVMVNNIVHHITICMHLRWRLDGRPQLTIVKTLQHLCARPDVPRVWML